MRYGRISWRLERETEGLLAEIVGDWGVEDYAG